MIDHIDPINRLIYLDSDTENTTISLIDIYKEVRKLRQDKEELRPYDMFLTMRGSVPKNSDGTKRTERYMVLLRGTLIVPYDESHSITIDGTLITDSGLEGTKCFDRSLLSSDTVVDINYTPKQVELIFVNQFTKEDRDKLNALPSSTENANAILTTVIS